LPLFGVAGLALGFALLALQRLGGPQRWWQAVPLLVVLSVITVLDLRTRIIPDVLTLPALAYSLVLALVSGGARGLGVASLGALAGGGVVLALAILSRGAVGGGDIKLVAMLGAALGWKDALVAFALSQVVGGVAVLGVLLWRREGRRQPMPIGALIAILGALLLAVRP
jgi:Flp pilus assembly protein protease CpaA